MHYLLDLNTIISPNIKFTSYALIGYCILPEDLLGIVSYQNLR